MITSHSSSHPYRSTNRQPGLVVWFISFGDLLTLLLCFFLVLTPWDHLKEITNEQSLQAGTLRVSDGHQRGITLAYDLPLSGSVIKHELPIFRKELEVEDSLMFGFLERELSGAWSSTDRIEVLVCGPVEERARVVHGVGEVLTRTSRKDVRVRFHVTLLCGENEVLAPVTEQLVGRIRVLRT